MPDSPQPDDADRRLEGASRSGPRVARPWERCLLTGTPHGILAGVALPAPGSEPPEIALQRLHPRERAACAGMAGVRLDQWVGGRLALQHCLRRLRGRRQPFLRGPGGEVLAPRHLSASISHKRSLAVALLGQASAGALGVDLETLAPERCHLAPRILGPTELEAWERLPGARRWPALLLAFSIKEAAYKAIFPRVLRYVSFHEAEVLALPDGSASVRVRLQDGPSFEVEARYLWTGRDLICTARDPR